MENAVEKAAIIVDIRVAAGMADALGGRPFEIRNTVIHKDVENMLMLASFMGLPGIPQTTFFANTKLGGVCDGTEHRG